MKNKIYKTTTAQSIARIILGLFLLGAGIGHLIWITEFRAQVPTWVPMDVDLVVILSGIVEIMLGVALIFLSRYKFYIGWIVALFFVLVFPGNIAQLVEHRDAFGLDTDFERWLRLPFQFVLIFLALWSTGAWRHRKTILK